VLSKVLTFVTESYFDKQRLRPLDAYRSSLDFIERETPDVLIEHPYTAREPWLDLRVSDTRRRFVPRTLDTPSSLQTALRRVLGFVQDNLISVRREEEGPRLLAIEIAATNGVLDTLDPHSVLLDGERYRTMRGRPEGPAGAIGIAVARDGREQIVVDRVVADTPAARAGVAAGDRLVRVEGLDTSRMMVEDVIDHLVGGIGTTVQVTVARDGAEARTIAITRDARYRGSFFPPRVLKGEGKGGAAQPVGYLRLEKIPPGAAQSVTDALATFKREAVTGVILDLRGSSGSSYGEAIKVADALLDQGTIVSMVGVGGTPRKDEIAHNDGDEPRVPLVVLVDRGTAAAGEIVASALRDRDRALLVGETTWGNGSVQVMFDIESPITHVDTHRLGLKLTTAQWLSPAGTSIQGTGLAPDVALTPERVSNAPGDSPLALEPVPREKEADYVARLRAAAGTTDVRPSATLPFVYDHSASKTDQTGFADAAGRDFAVELARDLLGAVKSPSRARMLEEARTVIERARTEEERRLVAALNGRGLDWSAGAAGEPRGRVELALATEGDAAAVAGQHLVIRGEAKNTGTVRLHRVRAVLEASLPALDGQELVFGTLDPGASRAAEVSIKIPVWFPSAAAPISARIVSDERAAGNPAELVAKIEGRSRPIFALSYRSTDVTPTSPQMGADQIERQIRVDLQLRNVGASPARTTATLRNGAGQMDVLIDSGLCRAPLLAPGATFDTSFVFRDELEHRDEPYEFDLSLGDDDWGLLMRRHLSHSASSAAAGMVAPPIVSASAPLVVHGGSARVTGEAAGGGRVRDLYMISEGVGPTRRPHKVFYLVNRAVAARVPFAVDVPVEAGSNLLRIVARGDDGAATTTWLSVLAIPPFH
jgi:carboxyl-terminal processing protease